MRISDRPFGVTQRGEAVTAWQLENGTGGSVTVLDYGATIQSLCIPNGHGGVTDVVLGYDTLAEYETSGGHLGGTIGRVGNRIGGAAFTLGGKRYPLAKNDGENHLHGGPGGFDHQMWRCRPEGDALVFTRISPDGEEGYPGELTATLRVTLSPDNALALDYQAETTADTPVNLTNHSYFNLKGGGTVLDHELQVFAQRFAETGPGCLPTGRLLEVAGTALDFRTAKAIGRDLEADCPQLRLAGGYDHTFVLSGPQAAVVRSRAGGLEMTVTTDLPGMQVYTANFLTARRGRGGATLEPRDGLCLETQLFPDGMAHWGWPSPVLRAGETLHTRTVYAFRTI